MFFRLFTSLMFVGCVFSTNSKLDTLYINVENSKLRWQGSKISSNHYGHIDIKNGYIVVDSDNDIIGGLIDIDMNSMVCDDIKDPNSNAYLIRHLKAEDFFDVSKFPLSSLQIEKSERLKASSKIYNRKISGQLNIKGNSKSIIFPLMVNHEKNFSHASGEINFDRTLWGINYKSSKFFPDLGDRIILDIINLKFYIETIKK